MVESKVLFLNFSQILLGITFHRCLDILWSIASCPSFFTNCCSQIFSILTRILKISSEMLHPTLICRSWMEVDSNNGWMQKSDHQRLIATLGKYITVLSYNLSPALRSSCNLPHFSMATQVFIVDNTSSRIIYNGSWFPYRSAEEQWKNYGSPYGNTSQGTSSPASFSFSFSGTAVEIMGPNDEENYWECLIDNKKFAGRDSYPFGPLPNLLTFCKGEGFRDGPHILVVNVISIKPGKPFWFDRIQYSPSSNELSANENAYVENWDSSLKYGSGWAPAKTNGNMTNVTGFNFEIEFTGISVAWYSWIAPDYPQNPTTATYSLDDGSAQKFALKGLADGASPLYNQLFFETSPLPVGRHKLSVSYNGQNVETDTPLVLDYLVVRSGTSTDEPSSPIKSSPTDMPSNTHRNKITKIGIIVGCAIAVLVISTLISYLLLRRQRQWKRLTLARPFLYYQTASISAFSSSSGRLAEYGAGERPTHPGGKRQGLQLHSDLGTDDPIVVLHEDSGVRGLSDTQQNLVELPPQYTAG
ncbi:hypothetical protein CPB83DRAFT_860678 [Crepidotus variabilis]|uniref:Uncharacterized protein n=1 Tax=Crepidotus variabilis TaxID=179855 RepID=A0A9P6E947_9AGAR|nr:hypothetical protein CPB83DRAFT_860678 [Crepidotus variabilis]